MLQVIAQIAMLSAANATTSVGPGQHTQCVHCAQCAQCVTVCSSAQCALCTVGSPCIQKCPVVDTGGYFITL